MFLLNLFLSANIFAGVLLNEILALFNFMKTQEGISINKKQSIMTEKTMLMVSEDAVKLSESIGIAFQENPELIQSLMK